MRFPNGYMLGLHRRTIKTGKETYIVPANATKNEARINQKTGTREAPQRWKTVHQTQKKETADSRYLVKLKAAYGSDTRKWPTINGVVVDPDTLKDTTFPLDNKEKPAPKKFNLKVEK